jgi:hypothetical protein
MGVGYGYDRSIRSIVSKSQAIDNRRISFKLKRWGVAADGDLLGKIVIHVGVRSYDRTALIAEFSSRRRTAPVRWVISIDPTKYSLRFWSPLGKFFVDVVSKFTIGRFYIVFYFLF